MTDDDHVNLLTVDRLADGIIRSTYDNVPDLLAALAAATTLVISENEATPAQRAAATAFVLALRAPAGCDFAGGKWEDGELVERVGTMRFGPAWNDTGRHAVLRGQIEEWVALIKPVVLEKVERAILRSDQRRTLLDFLQEVRAMAKEGT